MDDSVTDIDGQIHARTGRAILFSDDGDKDGAKWLPLSQIEVTLGQHGAASVTLPEWLAIDKGFA